MQCLHPIKVDKFVEQDHFGIENDFRPCPPLELKPPYKKQLAKYIGHRGYITKVEIPCGKCEACLSNYRQEWVQRLTYEFRAAKTAAFVTLTYDDEHLNYNDNGVPSVNKRDVQLFMKRLRKKYGSGIRYFLISEYGDNPAFTQRPHYHMLLFNYPPKENILLAKEINELWKKTDPFFNLTKVVEPINGNRIGYVAGYTASRRVVPPGADPNFMLASRRPGIGANYLTPAKQEYHYRTGNLSCQTETGSYPLHRYFRDKISDDESKLRSKEQYENYVRSENRRKYGFEDWSFTWTTAEVAAHGLTQDEYKLICHNYNERVKSWVERFRKKQLHKHIK